MAAPGKLYSYGIQWTQNYLLSRKSNLQATENKHGHTYAHILNVILNHKSNSIDSRKKAPANSRTLGKSPVNQFLGVCCYMHAGYVHI